jgi:conjugal transfer ATP-binding protein TraC
MYDPNDFIYNQVVQADSEYLVNRRSIQYDGVFGKAITIKQYPEDVSVLDTVHFIGNLFRNELQLSCPFLLTLNCYIQDDSLKNAQHQKAEFLYKQQSASALSITLERKQEEARWGLEKISEGHKHVKASLTWWFYHAEMEAVTKSVQTLNNLLLIKEYKIQEEIRNMNLALLWQSTPMNASYEMEDTLLKRWRTMFEFNASHLAPLQADWKGTGTPVAPFFSVRGQLQNIDLFDGPEGYNVCIAAMTGKGKSFLINHLISAYRTMPKVSNIWIVDVGDSYKPWCETVGGTYIDLNDKDDIVLNPFSDCDDLNADMDLFVRLISKMAKPSEDCTDTEKSIIEEAIKKAYDLHGKKTTVDRLIETLHLMSADNPDQLVKKNAIATIATNLFRWSTDGVYGRYFNGDNNIDLSSRVVVLELKNLTQREDLKSVILMVLFYHIHRVVYLDNDLSKRKVLVFDEAWQHMNDEKVAAFIERAYRTFRKCGSSAITVTQGVSDYYQNNSTKQMFFQAAYRFLLGQTQESLELLRKEAQLCLGEYDFEVLSRLKTVRGHYSEMFIMSPFGRGTARLVVPPALYWLYTTDADDAAKRKPLVDQYGIKEGIQKCVELYSK